MGTEKPMQSLRSAFIEEQKTHTDTVIEEAQRLVNLYRHADAFGEDFMGRLDQMLLSASPEVQTALSDILGGQIVRKYCAYIKERLAPQMAVEDKPEEKVIPKRGYLPEPDEVSVGGSQGNAGGNIDALLDGFLSAHREELKELLKAQSDNLATILERLDKGGHEGVGRSTDRLVNTIQQETGNQKKYADVIEASVQTPVLVPDETEGF